MTTRNAATHLSRCLCVSLLLPTASVLAEDVPATATAPEIPAAADAQLVAVDNSDRHLHTFITHNTDALGRRCVLHGAASSGALRFLACGSAGLWICRAFPDGTLSLVAERDLGGAVSGFFLRDGRLWVELTSVRAQELGLPGGSDAPRPSVMANASTAVAAGAPVAPTAPVAAAPPVTPTAPPLAAARAAARDAALAAKISWEVETGHVQKLEPGSAIISINDMETLAIGSNIAFYPPVSGTTDLQDTANARQILAVGSVVATTPTRARVQLGVNEAVPLGSTARRSQLPTTASSFAPPRAAGVWDVAFTARPFIVIDNLGAGALLDGHVGYHMTAPAHFEALISPLAFGTARGGGVATVAAVMTASYDSHLFEIGIGVGGQTVNSPDISLRPGSGTTIAQRLRLGARDGANVEVISYVALFHSEFTFSTLRVQAQIPLGSRTWLLAAGGGGTIGLGFGELGLRVLMAGNGGADSFFLTTVIGGVNLFSGCGSPQLDGSCPSKDYVGPMIGVGGEWRL